MVNLKRLNLPRGLMARRVFYVATGTAMLVALPEVLSSIPSGPHRGETMQANSMLLQARVQHPHTPL
jgi:hypothetical protein